MTKPDLTKSLELFNEKFSWINHQLGEIHSEISLLEEDVKSVFPYTFENCQKKIDNAIEQIQLTMWFLTGYVKGICDGLEDADD